MARVHKTAGRVAGTPIRKTQEITALLDSLGCNPIEGMAQIAMNERYPRNSESACTLSSRSTSTRKPNVVQLTDKDGDPMSFAAAK